MMATEAQIEVGARAIREVVVKRIWACSYPGVKPPIEWDKLKEEQREGYREEARAALTAASFIKVPYLPVR
jgi:hypothetical protein